MSLPKITQPLFEMSIPSNKKRVTYRPYLVKEEKILLVAKESDNENDILRAINQVINNCVQEDLSCVNLATFDVEYMFLKLRAASVNNMVELAYRDTEDDEVYKFTLNLDDVEVTFNENNNPKIKINDDLSMLMKYPSADIVNKMREFESEADLILFFIANGIEFIYNKDDVYVASEYSEEELNEFIDSLDVKTFDKVKNFFETLPRLYHKFEYVNKLGNNRVIELNNLKDFFTLG